MSHVLKRLSVLCCALLALAAFAPLATAADGTLTWKGLIAARPTGQVAGAWRVGDRPFMASVATTISETDGPLAIGSCAEVQYRVDGERLLALDIEGKAASVCSGGDGGEGGAPRRQIYAAVQQIPDGLRGDWTIGGGVYRADAATRIGGEVGMPTVGACVEVTFIVAGGVNLASEIERAPTFRCTGGGDGPGRPELVKRYGVLTARPDGLVGAWTIGGTAYQATTMTRFNQEDGAFYLGGCVSVVFPAGTTAAAEIGTAESERCAGMEGAERRFFGVVSSIPANTIGTWVIGGRSFAVIASTRRGAGAAPAIGACVAVTYTLQGDVPTAQVIETREAYVCNGDSYANARFGIITQLPADSIGTWVIGGVNIVVNEGTVLRPGDSAFAVGQCVRFVATFANDVVTAQLIRRAEGEACRGGRPVERPIQKIYALIDSLPAAPYVGLWSIGGISATATLSTTFRPGDAAFVAGQCVEAVYSTRGDANTLLRVSGVRLARCQEASTTIGRAYGPIEALPAAPFVGMWTIGGVMYRITAETGLEREYGPFAVGAFVRVRYVVVAGEKVARSVSTHVEPRSGQENVTGRVTSRPSDDSGVWEIDGVVYQADDAIEVDLPEASGAQMQGAGIAQASGAQVYANVYRDASGALRVTSISALSEVFIPSVQR